MRAMFTIPSIQKLLLLAAILGAVWYGFKFIGRLKDERDTAAKKQGTSAGQPNPWKGRQTASSEVLEAEEMVQCPVCRTYVAAKGAGSCGRSDCPY